MARCKECGEKFVQTQFLQKFCKGTAECMTAEALYNLDKIKKEDKKKRGKKKIHFPEVYERENKKEFARLCQQLARMIDLSFGYNMCIDCGHPFGKQQDGGHFKSKGANASLKYNLHNIHSQLSNCNRNGMGGGKGLEYLQGLRSRYGDDYAEYVNNGLQKKFTYIGLTAQDYPEKIKIIRKLIRDYDTFTFIDSIDARKKMNIIIGIYGE